MKLEKQKNSKSDESIYNLTTIFHLCFVTTAILAAVGYLYLAMEVAVGLYRRPLTSPDGRIMAELTLLLYQEALLLSDGMKAVPSLYEFQ